MRHPIVGNRKGLAVWIIASVFLVVVHTLLFSINVDLTRSLVDGIISVLVAMLLSVALWFPTDAIYKSQKKTLSFVVGILSLILILVFLWLFLSESFLSLFYDREILLDDSLHYKFFEGFFIFLLLFMFYYLILTQGDLAEKQIREAELEMLLRDNELKMLRSQINPHFLFNSLNSVSSLTMTDSEKAREMVVKLSEFMRYALNKRNDMPQPLSEELYYAKLYFDIEKVRFGDRMVIENKIDENLLNVKVPSLILQPVYENAVKHGVYENTSKVVISTEIKSEDGYAVITITNNFDPEGVPRRGTGIGLKNISRRLELSYGNKASFYTSKENDLFVAKMMIPI